jgi:hypothetical protein
MRMNAKIVSLLSAGLFLTACENTYYGGPDVGSSYRMPNTPGKGTFNVLVNGKRSVSFEATDLDILTERACASCDDGAPKEAALMKSNRELEIKVGDLTPNIRIDDIEVYCEGNNSSILVVDYTFVVTHAGGNNSGSPVIDVPVFLTSMDIPSQEVYANSNAMIKIDLNRPFEEQYARVRFDISDLKARNLTGWSFISGIMKSEMNRKFESEVARSRELKVAEAGEREINKFQK